MSKVSIIIPVYNVEKYLKKCLDSVINQTYKDIEIICVNDGSKDGSANILKEYALKDSRIKIIEKENSGLSSARNAGLDVASGEYCYFVDSDDWIELNTIEKLTDIILSNDVDVVVHSANNIPEDESCADMAENTQNWLDSHAQKNGIHKVPIDINNKIASVTWNKLYKMEIINKYNCRFPEGLINEDELFLWTYMIHCKNFYYTNEKLYNYLRRSDSIMGTRDYTPKVLDILDILKLIYETVKKYKNIDEYHDYLTQHYIGEVSWLFKRMPKKYGRNALIKIKKYYKTTNNDKEILNLYKTYKYKKLKQFIRGIFSVTNIKRHNYIGKQVKILGIKLKFKNKYKTLQKKFDMRLNDLETKLNNNKNEFENKLAINSRIFKDIFNSINKDNIATGVLDTKTISNNNDSRIRKELTSLGKFYFLPNRGNLGDVVIAAAEYQYFDSLNLEYEVFQQAPDEEFNLVYGGGGQWVQYYDCSDIIDIFRNPKIKKIVILPSSIKQCDDLAEFMDERFTVFCREEQSYNYCTSKNSRAKFIQADDMAFGLNIDNIGTYNKLSEIDGNDFVKIYTDLYENYKYVYNQIDKIKELTTSESDKRIGYFLRKDVESNNNWENCSFKHNLDISNLIGTYGLDKNFCYILSKLFLSIIDTVDIVVTDRLHVGICGYLLGKQAILIDNSYGKISGVYNYTMKKFDNVHYTTADNLKNTVENIAQNSPISAKHSIKTVSDIISFYNEYCSDKNYDLIEKIMWTRRDL